MKDRLYNPEASPKVSNDASFIRTISIYLAIISGLIAVHRLGTGYTLLGSITAFTSIIFLSAYFTANRHLLVASNTLIGATFLLTTAAQMITHSRAPTPIFAGITLCLLATMMLPFRQALLWAILLTLRVVTVKYVGDLGLFSWQPPTYEFFNQSLYFDAPLMPYEQATKYTSKSFGGTGLGLPISREIAILMGGTISCQSQVGKGSEFTVTLPYSVPNQSEIDLITKQSEAALSYPHLKVLVVDDNDVNRLIITKFLQKLSITVVEAADGTDAILKFGQGDFDLVLMDLQMPYVDGFQATVEIRKTERGRDVKIFALTANAMKEQQLECERAGMDGFLTKPINRKAIQKTIAEHFEQASNL